MELEHLRNIAIALGLGFLIGLQREWSSDKLAGIRTFPLIALLGALCGLLSHDSGTPWLMVAGLMVVAAMFWLGNRIRMAEGVSEPGLTTEIAALVVFLVGVLVTRDLIMVAVVVGGVVAVILHWKKPLHGLVARVGEGDLHAIIRLVIIAMVILPLLPNRDYGPYQVINPYEIWLMVVLIVGISMAAYLAHRILGSQVGMLLAGVLGGLISSTATAVSYARRSRDHVGDVKAAALVIMVSSTVVFPRVLLEVAVVAPAYLMPIAGPLVVMMVVMLLLSLIMLASARTAIPPAEDGEAPSELGTAVGFGLLYAAVLFGVAVAKDYFGDAGMYAVAGLSGLTDMDAITLSSAQLVKTGAIETGTGWRLILIGALANLVFKFGIVATIGNRRLVWRIGLVFAGAWVAGGALLAMWPD